MQNILGLVRRLYMTLRIACAADAEVALRLDVAHELGCIMVIAVRSAALRDVAAERKNVFDTVFLVFLNHLCNMLTGRGHASQMSQHSDVILLPEVSRNIDRVLARAAACAVGYAHEIRSQRRNLLRCSGYRLIAAARLGRKHLKGEGDLVLLQKFRNFHILYLLHNHSVITV